MKGTPLNTLPKESVDAIVRSTERIEGAASILAMLEEKADGGFDRPCRRCAQIRCCGANWVWQAQVISVGACRLKIRIG